MNSQEVKSYERNWRYTLSAPNRQLGRERVRHYQRSHQEYGRLYRQIMYEQASRGMLCVYAVAAEHDAVWHLLALHIR